MDIEKRQSKLEKLYNDLDQRKLVGIILELTIENIDLKKQLSIHGVVKSLKNKTELAIDVWLKDNNYTLTNDGYTRNEITFSFGEMHKRYNEYLKTL